jgi:hypothetical protein
MGQESRVEILLNKQRVSCQDVSENSQILIPEYYQRGNRDTINGIMQYWEEKCGLSEELFRLKVLLAIQADTFNEKTYSNLPVLNYVLTYKDWRIYYLKISQQAYYKNIVLSNANFDRFTQNLAEALSRKNKLQPIEKFYVNLYAKKDSNSFLEPLKDSALNATMLKKQYDSTLKHYLKKPKTHLSFFSGIWIPTQNLKTLGIHPILGTQMGFETRKFCFDITGEVRFLKSANPYHVEKDGVHYSTQHYFGGLLGLDAAYSLGKRNKNELLISCGAAYEGFDALTQKSTSGKEETLKSIGTFNLNPGISIRRFIFKRSYIGLDFRYNIINYNNKNGTDISGNAFTIRLKYGVLSNPIREYGLKQLEY